jgi:DNA repair exonuclease SbcCD ATPase subunit
MASSTLLFLLLKIITRLTEKDVEENKEKISELNKKLESLGYSEANEQENSLSASSEEIIAINQNIKILREHRFELYARRKVLSGSYVETVESIDGELARLKRFFGDSIKCEEIEKIQQFHLRIQAILKEESNEELQKIESDLAKTNQEISELMKKTIELDQPVGVSRSYIDEITNIKAEISKLEDLNRNYSAREKIRTTVGEAKNILQNVKRTIQF